MTGRRGGLHVDRGQDEHVNVLGQQVLDLARLKTRVIVGGLHGDFDAQCLGLLLDVLLVELPTPLGQRAEAQSDEDVLGAVAGCTVALLGGAGGEQKGKARQSQTGHQADLDDVAARHS